jgi:hypothetical protein
VIWFGIPFVLSSIKRRLIVEKAVEIAIVLDMRMLCIDLLSAKPRQVDDGESCRVGSMSAQDVVRAITMRNNLDWDTIEDVARRQLLLKLNVQQSGFVRVRWKPSFGQRCWQRAHGFAERQN